MTDIPPEALQREEVRLTLDIGATQGEELLTYLEEANLSLAQTIAALGFALAWVMHVCPDTAARMRSLDVLTSTCNAYRDYFQTTYQKGPMQ